MSWYKCNVYLQPIICIPFCLQSQRELYQMFAKVLISSSAQTMKGEINEAASAVHAFTRLW